MFVQTITFHHNSHSSSSRADLTQTSPTVSNETNNTTKKPTQQYKIAVRRAKDACRMWSAKLSVRWTAVCIHFKHYIYYILVYSVGESDKCSPKVRASEATILRYCRQQQKVISPGSPLVTLYEQRCFTYFKLLQLKRKREEEKGITLIQKLPQIQDSNGWFPREKVTLTHRKNMILAVLLRLITQCV